VNRQPGQGEIWTVTAVVQKLQTTIAQAFPPLWIEGEISNYSRSAAGHRYFTLKDERNQLKAALFRGRSRALKFEPADGQKVVALGRLDVYGPRSEYQLIVEQVLPVGQGELELAFRQLHARLKEEGLFDAERKQPLPAFPRRIGVVTSARGAAIRDILNVLARRAPHVEVIVAPTLVQGAEAAPRIASAIGACNQLPAIDLLIVTRGGGSLEDLWPFNEELVVRALAASHLPVVTGIGHEVDLTLSDLAADLRAPTPSAAAELAVRDRREWLEEVGLLTQRMTSEIGDLVEAGRSSLSSLVRRYGFRRPAEALLTFVQWVDNLTQRLQRAGRATARERVRHVRYLADRPVLTRPELWLEPRREQVGRLTAAFRAASPRIIGRVRDRLGRASGGLEALSPRAVLERGYAIVTDERGRVITSARTSRPGQRIRALLKDGRLTASVDSVETDRTWP
jgi:exodeoxyribonuclease VII large subunit